MSKFFKNRKSYKSSGNYRKWKKQYPKRVFWSNIEVKQDLSHVDIQAMIPQAFCDEAVVAWVHKIKVTNSLAVGLHYLPLTVGEVVGC